MKNLMLIVIAFSVSFGCAAQPGNFSTITEKNGKIGIGTKSPDELLTVKGKIHTQEVKVDLNGAVAPDYVFESYYTGSSELQPGYERMSLKDLEQFIKNNYHLPEVPSAETMNEEGIQLKEFNLLLLKKIEELTLYTLEQQQEIETLKLQVEKVSSSRD